MPTDSLRGSVQSVFLDFTYSSGSEIDFKYKKNAQGRYNYSSRNIRKSNGTSSNPSTGRLSAGATSTLLDLKGRKRKLPACKASKPNTNVTHVHLQLNTTPEEINQDLLYCKENVKKQPRTNTRGTQTLYRESSAQTLPYLPEVKNDAKVLEYIEIFKLPKIIPGDGPPGLYEVEMLERARKRWAFADSLRNKFKNNIELARKQICQSKYKKILESFAFEQWLEREEHIMECQMMRMEIVIRMFNNREQEMHRKSNEAISTAQERILAQRDAALLKNDIDFRRAARRLETTRAKKIRLWRIWRKQLNSRRLGDPKSLYNAPQKRFGVNPCRRHLQLFDNRIFDKDAKDVEKDYIDFKNVECPFAKLSKWAEPKTVTEEIEMDFLTDSNLQKLYDSLKTLRLQLVKHKVEPKCLIKKQHRRSEPKNQIAEIAEKDSEELDADERDGTAGRQIRFMIRKSQKLRATRKFSNFLYEMRMEYKFRRLRFFDKRREEIENLLAAYEGKRIGWILRFLGEEKMRLTELQKLHTITILAQRERWRREAAEAGLRQKENDVRQLFEELYRYVEEVNKDVGEAYLNDIIKPDTYAYADDVATAHIEQLAKQIDSDLGRWISTFMDVQQPTTYDFLRYLLKDLVFPNVNDVLHNKEKKKVVHYIIHEVILPNVFEKLESFDISFAISSQLISRLIDDDLLMFSSEDCSSVCDCGDVCDCPDDEKETKAILRKLIRYAVPGRRWKTEDERIAYENFMDIVDEAFDTIDHDRFYDGACQTRLWIKDDEALTSTNTTDVIKSDKSSEDELKAAESYWYIPEYKPKKYPGGFSVTDEIYSEVLLKTHKHSVMLSKQKLMETVVFGVLSDIFNSLLLPCDESINEENILRDDESQYEICRKEVICEETEEYRKEETQSVETKSESSSSSSSSSSSYLEITQSELNRMLEDRCKCTEEIARELYIQQMMLLGKVRIIGKPQDIEKSVSEVTTFVYQSEGAEELPMDDVYSKLSYNINDDYVGEDLEKLSDSEIDKAIEERSEVEHVGKTNIVLQEQEGAEQVDLAKAVDGINTEQTDVEGKDGLMESTLIEEPTIEQPEIARDEKTETQADEAEEPAGVDEPVQIDAYVDANVPIEPEAPSEAASEAETPAAAVPEELDPNEKAVAENPMHEISEELPPEEPDRSDGVEEQNKRRTLIDE